MFLSFFKNLSALQWSLIAQLYIEIEFKTLPSKWRTDVGEIWAKHIQTFKADLQMSMIGSMCRAAELAGAGWTVNILHILNVSKCPHHKSWCQKYLVSYFLTVTASVMETLELIFDEMMGYRSSIPRAKGICTSMRSMVSALIRGTHVSCW